LVWIAFNTQEVQRIMGVVHWTNIFPVDIQPAIVFAFEQPILSTG